MDLGTQGKILELATEANGDPPIVLLGSPDAESAELAAVTVTTGDPTFAGPLAGIPLGLPVYHVLEELVKVASNADAYDEQISLMESVLEAQEIRDVMQSVRAPSA